MAALDGSCCWQPRPPADAEGATTRAAAFCLADADRESQTSVPATYQKHWCRMTTDGIRRIEITTQIAFVVIPPYSAC
jgi:hypothetical protein